jgi:hypothetical protein
MMKKKKNILTKSESGYSSQTIVLIKPQRMNHKHIC